MKDWKYIIRIVGVLAAGIMLFKMTCQFEYSTFIFDLFFFDIIVLFGAAILIWSIMTDLKQFRIERRIIQLLPFFIGLSFTLLICLKTWQINSTFDKPTLLRVYYDGDFNGTRIDFKSDGTYIFDNSAIGLSDFSYGTYRIIDNQILLDKSELENVIKTNRLEIKPKTIEYSEGAKTEDYVFQINKEGNILENVTEFRVVVDNRK